jgi:hypothetical protein
VFHIFQGIFLILALNLYLASGSHPFAILLFFILKVIFDQCAEKLCKYTETSSLRIIFLNNNALVRQMIICWALTKAESITGVFFAVSVDFLATLVSLAIVCGPLTFYTEAPAMAFVTLFNWIVRREYIDERLMTEKDRRYAIGERTKEVYFFSLYSFGEIILGPWQMAFFQLFNSTYTKKAYYGFDRETNGWFPTINAHALNLTCSIYSVSNVFNLVIFTYFVRKKFPKFEPFRFLNILLKKYNILLGLSVMSISQSIQCLMLIDCHFDDLTIIWRAFRKQI